MSNLLQQFKDREVINRLKNRDKEAFIKVYDDNVKDIYRFVYFKIGHEEEAKDLTSIIFLKTWNHIQNKTLENAKTLRALLYKIARTSIIDYYRENGGKSSTSLDDENNHLEIVDDSVDLEADLDKKANISLIKSKLPLLKDEYREVIILRFINDLTLEEIADISGKKKGNVRVLLHRALNSLREIIDSEPESTIKN